MIAVVVNQKNENAIMKDSSFIFRNFYSLCMTFVTIVIVIKVNYSIIIMMIIIIDVMEFIM